MENELNANSNDDSIEDNKILQQRIEYLERREKDLLREKEELEAEFGLKRAKLKDLFLRKEDELQKERDASTTILGDKEGLEAEIARLQMELNESKSQVTVAVVTLDSIEMEKRKCEEELASLHQIMEETVNESVYVNTKYEREMNLLKKLNEKLESENQELKNQIASDKEGVLSVVTKTFAKKVGSLNAHSQSNENLHDNLEDSMKKQQSVTTGNGWWAQEDAEMLRSLVVPLEEEIKALKDKLRAADEQLRSYEAAQVNLMAISPTSVTELLKGRTPTDAVVELDEKLKEVNKDLKAEKSSRSDLEMYVAVLQAQKTVLHEETDKLRKEMQEVCRLLETEKREHNDLKQTWQRANDQFLEVQRLQFSDLCRMKSLLTMEQQRQLEEMSQSHKEQQPPHHPESPSIHLEATVADRGSSSPILSRLSLRQRLSPSPNRENNATSAAIASEPGHSASDTSLSLKDSGSLDVSRGSRTTERSKSDSATPFDHRSFEDAMTRSADSLSASGESQDPFGEMCSTSFDLADGVDLAEGSASEGKGDHLHLHFTDRIPNLTEDQLKALADLTPEHEARKQLMQNARARPETLPGDVAGKRLVSEKEWLLLQDELKKARDKLSRTCDMCSNYEAQLQKVQEHEKDLEKKLHALEKSAERCREELALEQAARTEVEEKFAGLVTNSQAEAEVLGRQVREAEEKWAELRRDFRSCYDDVHAQMKKLTTQRDSVQADLVRLQKENDALVGKHSAHAQQMQNEAIELPLDPNEMHHMLLKLREELISAKVAKEQMEENLHSEIMFLKDHVTAEHQLKNNLEDTLTQEIDALRTQVGIYESIRQQLEEEQKRRAHVEQMMKEVHQAQNSSKQIISSLQKQTEELNALKASLEQESQELRCKVQALQVELENGEAVQRDFVKLSQSLQVQLEKIRDSENEVRWQHEEDVVDCSNCKQPFHGPTRKKRHCRHCGKIFCLECTSKVVLSGPNNRQSRVCDVCHTLLVPNTAPYFSKEPPHTPD